MRTTYLLVGSLIASCSSNHEATPIKQEPPMTKSVAAPPMTVSDRCEAVRDLMIDTAVHQLVAGGYNPGYPYPQYGLDAVPAAKVAEDRADFARSEVKDTTVTAGPNHYTTTNVQEHGVDEGDLVKTDGKFVYTIRNNELLVAKTWPVESAKLVSRVSFQNFTPTQLYLRGDKVIVHGISYDPTTSAPTTRIAIIDVTDRSAPKLARTVDVDGQNLSSRVVDGDLYLVQSTAVQVPQALYDLGQQTLAKIPRADQASLRPWEIQSRLAKTLHDTLASKLSTDDVAAMMPKIKTGSATSTMKCSDLYIPQDNIQLGITALARITVDNQRNDIVGAMVSGGQVYASTESVYVSAPAYTWNNQGYANYTTQIHKFSLTANDGRPTYVATGSVDGQPLDQFSMSEYDGNLRIATTDWNWNGAQGGNNLFVLHPNGHTLETIGALRGIAQGERIYAGRMFGDKGYLVTFRQTDPLFTLDLSNPRAPKIAGELKINGFSNYIHPMGGDLLLAIGQDADDNGRVEGFHMQVFDVSDPAHPTRRFHEKLSSWSTYSSSMAQTDHHAFTYDPVSGTLALPVAGSTSEGEQYNGLVVYNIDRKNGFTLVGRVTHRQLAKEALEANCDAQDPWAGTYYCTSQSEGIAMLSQIDRSIVVDKFLLSLGTAGMEIHSLDHISTRAARLRWPVAQSITNLVVTN